MIAYRCLYPDHLYHDNETINFSWISGSWVDPEYRRQGLSMKILKHIVDDLKIPLLFSNYAPQSKALYDKSAAFKSIRLLNGKRRYFRFALYELLPARHVFFRKIKPLLWLTDAYLNAIFDVRFSFQKEIQTQSLCKEVSLDDPAVEAFVANANTKNPFRRNTAELKHSAEYPWVIEKPEPDDNDKKYIFSSTANRFQYLYFKIADAENNIQGFFMLKIRDHAISLPYAFIQDSDADLVRKRILFYVKKYKLKYLTVFNNAVNNSFNTHKSAVLYSKPMVRDFYCDEFLQGKIKPDHEFYEGDGDHLYT